MARPLSILLPVHNAESTLIETATQVLEAASDMADSFELLIIDDGSTDGTHEIAMELIRHYPQVRIARHSAYLGRDAALRTGMSQSKGEIVCVREGARPILDRQLDQSAEGRKHASTKPSRPNFLGRTRLFVRDDHA